MKARRQFQLHDVLTHWGVWHCLGLGLIFATHGAVAQRITPHADRTPMVDSRPIARAGARVTVAVSSPASSGATHIPTRIPPADEAVMRTVYLPPLHAATHVVDRVSSDDSVPPSPQIKPISQIDLDYARNDQETPPDYAGPWLRRHGLIHHVTGTSRRWPMLDYRWAASAVAYHPLYFEDVNLERYGYSCRCLQPAVSCAHFFGNLVLLPYHVAETLPCESEYSLGFALPGSCPPIYHKRLRPMSVCGSAAEAATIAGLILVIP